MKVAFHQIAFEIPLSHVIRIETLEFSAAFHNHAVVHLKLLLEDGFQNEEIEGLEGGAALTLLWEDGVIFEGLITSASLLREQAITYLYLSASSYTLQWDFIRRSHSYGNEAMTYRELIQQVVNRYDHSAVIDCIAGEQRIPGFLLQYEETDWVFLQRLASHFGTFLVPDYKDRTGRIYFGLPREREPVIVTREDYVMNRNMETYYKLSGNDQFLPQEASKWQINCPQLFELGDEMILNEVMGIVTAIHYQLSDGELTFTYEVSRKSGLVCFYQSNPRIYGMSLPGIVKNRSGNQIRVHLEIDETYTETGDTHWFTYAIESSGIRSLPQINSKVHIYFPGHIEQEAFAVHAVRLDAGEKSRTRYMPAPSYKSFSDVNGSQIYLDQHGSGLIAGAEAATHIILSDAGEIEVKGSNIQLLSTDEIVIGGTLCPQYLVARGSSMVLGLNDGTEQGFIINKNLGISARMLNVDADGSGYTELVAAAGDFIAEVTKDDKKNRDKINQKAREAIIQRITDARKKRNEGILMVISGTVTIIVSFLPVVGQGVLAGKIMLATVYAARAGSAAYIVVGLAEVQEGQTDLWKLMDGDISGGDNFIKDVTGEEMYALIKASVTTVYMVTSATLATGIMSTMTNALTACAAKQGASVALHMGKNVGRTLVHDFFVNGSVDLNSILGQAALGYVQGMAGGFLGNMAGKYLGEALGGGMGAYLIGELVGTTGVDVAMDWAYSTMNGQEFDWASSIWLNLLANGVSMLIQEPVDAASGGYYIDSEDLIISGICNPMELRRRYLSVNRGSGSMGKGWRFSYDSRLRFDQEKLHLDVPTGHRLLFAPVRAEEGEVRQWQLESKGCGWFSLREEQGQPGVVYKYDGDANPIRIHYPEGGCERRFYDGAGNLVKKVEPEYYQPELNDGAGYQYAYDAGNHLIEEINPAGEVVACYEYDVYGSLIREWDELGKDIRYVYDGAGNRTQMWEKTEEAQYRSVFYEYDNCSNKRKERYGQELTKLWEAPASYHELRFSYDANHHLMQCNYVPPTT